MQFSVNGIYHIYNQGNNQERVFYTEANYRYFLSLVRKFLLPETHLLAFCLMPNHFHLLVQATTVSCVQQTSGGIRLTKLSSAIRDLLSSYTQAINKQERRSGSLFRQRTKSKEVTPKDDYLETVVHYIHQNPVAAGLVDRSDKWVHSSVQEYLGLAVNPLCRRDIVCQLTGLTQKDFSEQNNSGFGE